MATLILLRHGQSVWNAANKFTGWTDVELSKVGEAEAKKASASEARTETRRTLAALEAERKENKLRAEQRKANWLYVQQHMAADLVADAKAFLRGAHGEGRARGLLARAKKAAGLQSASWRAEKYWTLLGMATCGLGI